MESPNNWKVKKDILTSVFERMRTRLLAKASNVLSDDDEAHDVLQESFYRLWGKRAAINNIQQAEGLLMTTVRNLSIDMRRRRNTHPTRLINEAFDRHDDTAYEEESRRELLNSVERIVELHLSQRDRDILLKRDRDGWEFSEIAAIHGMTEGNVRVVVVRARKTVREIYNRKL